MPSGNKKYFTAEEKKAALKENKRRYNLRKRGKWTGEEKHAANARSREWYQRNIAPFPEKKREFRYQKHIKEKYGLTGDSYRLLLSAQGGGCAICRRNEGKLTVDHCHDTGKVRGILCQRCNTGLGHFRDSPELLREACNYLISRSQ